MASQTKQRQAEVLQPLHEQQPGKHFFLQMNKRHSPKIIHMISMITPAPYISKPDEEPDTLSEVGEIIILDIVVVGDAKLDEERATLSEVSEIILLDIAMVGDTKPDEERATLSEVGRVIILDVVLVGVVVIVIVFGTRPIVVSLL